MHGLVNRSIQCFIRDTYGVRIWREVSEKIDLPLAGFEAMLLYEDQLTFDLIKAAARLLRQDEGEFLESLGGYLVTHENVGSVRRLLRFGGEAFEDFLRSLEELPDRARIAVPDLELPNLKLNECGQGHFELRCIWQYDAFGHVVMGVLRGMADDYGALVLLGLKTAECGDEVIEITVAETSFAEGRSFQLAQVLE